MTKHKEKEEDVIEQKDAEKEAVEEVSEMEESVDDKALADKYLNNWKRAVADFENYKKRQAESAKEFAKFASLNLILQILPVLDNFHASTAHVPEGQKNDPWVTGIMHIQKQLEKVLEDNGVAEISVKEGDEFDPEMHEAVSNNQETRNNDQATEEAKNKISKIIQRGYKIDGKVIRPARVVVE